MIGIDFHPVRLFFLPTIIGIILGFLGGPESRTLFGVFYALFLGAYAMQAAVMFETFIQDPGHRPFRLSLKIGVTATFCAMIMAWMFFPVFWIGQTLREIFISVFPITAIEWRMK